MPDYTPPPGNAADAALEAYTPPSGSAVDVDFFGGVAATISGSATIDAYKENVVTGGKKIIITLSGDTWVAAGGTFDAIRQDIIDGLDSAAAEANGWNAEVRDKQDVAGVVRTSDTVVTITLDAQAAYDITTPEAITVTVPGSAVTGGSPIVGSPTFEIVPWFVYTGSGGSISGGIATIAQPDITGSGGSISGGSAGIAVFIPVRPGISHVDVYNVNGVFQGRLTPLDPYKLSRYQNQVGNWECRLPVDEEINGEGIPLARKIEYGWKIDITQENFSPENAPGSGHLLYHGIVEDRSFGIDQGGNTFLQLAGSRRTYEAVRRSVLQNLDHDGPLSTLTTTLIGNLLDPYGPIYDANAINAHVKGEFNDLSRYAAWIKAAQLGRRVIRETWDHDRPELVRYDGPPDSGITFRPASDSEKGGSAAAYAARYAHDTGQSGVALIAGRPSVRWDGSNVVNRIIAKGVDTVADPEDPEGTISDVLTLQHATLTSPYTVKAGVNPDNSLYFYIEDEDSIERYGLTELVLTFSDVKNPNDLLASRQAAANVLYMRTVNELIKRRSEKIEVTIGPLANGSKIWALPGDSAILEYHGEVLTASGAAIWMDIDRRMLISERHEESHPSGIRQVAYKLAAPEMEFPVPGLPGEIIFPPDDGGGPGDPDAPGSEPCCDDPNDEQNEGPEDEWEDTFPTPEAQCARYGRPPLNVIVSGGGEGVVPWVYKIDGDLDFGSTPIFSFAVPDLGEGTWTVTVRLGIKANPLWPDNTWTVKIKSGSTVLESASYPLTSGSSNQQTTEDGFPFFPTVGTSFSAGEYTSVRVVVSPGVTGGATIGYGGDSYIQLCFTPA